MDPNTPPPPNDLVRPPVRRRRALLFELILLVALIGFVFLALFAQTSAYFPIDLTITQAAQDIHVAGLAPLMRAISWPGYMPQALVFAGLGLAVLWLVGWRREAKWYALTAVLAQAANSLVKFTIQRPRPGADLVDVVRESATYSFPSGHTMFYTAVIGLAWFFVFTRLRHSLKRTGLLALLGMVIALVGPSRIYLGEHWASDVLGGYLLGGLVLYLMVVLYRRGSAPAPGEPEHLA